MGVSSSIMPTCFWGYLDGAVMAWGGDAGGDGRRQKTEIVQQTLCSGNGRLPVLQDRKRLSDDDTGSLHIANGGLCVVEAGFFELRRAVGFAAAEVEFRLERAKEIEEAAVEAERLEERRAAVRQRAAKGRGIGVLVRRFDARGPRQLGERAGRVGGKGKRCVGRDARLLVGGGGEADPGRANMDHLGDNAERIPTGSVGEAGAAAHAVSARPQRPGSGQRCK